MWKWLLGLFVIAVAGCGTGGWFLAQSEDVREFLKGFRPQDKPVEVRLSAVERGKVVRTVNSPGAIEPKTKVQISAQVSARITALPFREGERVKGGDIVVKLDARDLAAALESAQASERAERARLEGAEATLARAEQELARQRELSRTGDSARNLLESAESEARRARSSVESSRQSIEIAKANIARAQKDLENTEIRAPFDGIITKLNAEVGELVVVGTLNNAASVIMEIADLEVMLLKARVDESNIAPIKAGQRASVYINAFRDRTFEGVVDRVGLKRQVDRDGTGYYEVEVLVKKPEGQLLYSGLTANTDIEVETHYDVLKVPSQAVLDRRIDDLPVDLREHALIDKSKAFARVVYVMVDGKAKARPVSVGASDLTHTIILGGIEEGAKIVAGPFKVLVDMREDRKIAEEGTLKKAEDAKKSAAATGGAGKSEEKKDGAGATGDGGGAGAK
ncbi:MAG: efflux RND transporter periplasmic adaptor subunit [Phycisphaerae bacterium]|nr:efflux RND transporter periplasmic adaptor subunit [Phycisphaerae bacterium]